MQRTSKQSGFSIFIVLIALAVSVFTISTLVVVRNNQNKKTDSSKTAKSQKETAKSVCASKANVKLCVIYPKSVIGYTEKIDLLATLTNEGKDEYEWYGSSSCQENATLLINDQGPSGACTTDIAKFTLAPNEKRTNTLNLTGAQIGTGSGTVAVVWGDLTSPKINFSVKAITPSDKKITQTCFGSDDQPFCASLTVVLNDQYFTDQTTCDDVAKYFITLKLQPQKKYCQLANLGAVYFIVPKQDANLYKDKLAAFPQVQSVEIDR